MIPYHFTMLHFIKMAKLLSRNTPLRFEVVSAPCSIIDVLISMASETSCLNDAGGRLPHHYAKEYNNINAVESLLNAYPEAAFKKDKNGKTPVHWAAMRAHRCIICLMLSTALARMIHVVGCQFITLLIITTSLLLSYLWRHVQKPFSERIMMVELPSIC